MEITERKQNILVVDDDKMIRNTLVANLKLLGYDVSTANDCDEALNQMDNQYPDLALLDLHMPNKNGFETAKELRDRMGKTRLPVIFMTSDPKEKFRKTAARFKHSDFMSKPYSGTQLRALVQTWL